MNLSAKDCSICIKSCSASDGDTSVLECMHFMHTACIWSWLSRDQLNRFCPLCRTPISQELFELLENKHARYQQREQEMSLKKKQAILRIVHSQEVSAITKEYNNRKNNLMGDKKREKIQLAAIIHREKSALAQSFADKEKALLAEKKNQIDAIRNMQIAEMDELTQNHYAMREQNCNR